MTVAKKPLTQEQIKVILNEIVVQVLKDEKLWTKIGHDLDLSDAEISRVWDYANEQLRNEEQKQ